MDPKETRLRRRVNVRSYEDKPQNEEIQEEAYRTSATSQKTGKACPGTGRSKPKRKQVQKINTPAPPPASLTLSANAL